MSLHTSARPPSARTSRVRPDQQAEVRSLLEQHRQARQDQIQAHSLADLSSSDLDPAARMRICSAAEETLREIDLALLRLEDGSYGSCVGCSTGIPAERLLTVPYARHCVRCA